MRDYFLRVQQWIGARLVSARRNDVGAVSTETAVITFLLVGIAMGVLGIILVAANGWAEAIPDAPGG